MLPFCSARMFHSVPVPSPTNEPYLPAYLPRRQTENTGKCRVSQFQVCQMVYGHLRFHSCRDDLHDFQRLLTYDMRAEQAVGGT